MFVITTTGEIIRHNANIEWDANHLCPAAALTPEEAAMFHVEPYQETSRPDFDPYARVGNPNPGKLYAVWQAPAVEKLCGVWRRQSGWSGGSTQARRTNFNRYPRTVE